MVASFSGFASLLEQAVGLAPGYPFSNQGKIYGMNRLPPSTGQKAARHGRNSIRVAMMGETPLSGSTVGCYKVGAQWRAKIALVFDPDL